MTTSATDTIIGPSCRRASYYRDDNYILSCVISFQPQRDFVKIKGKRGSVDTQSENII